MNIGSKRTYGMPTICPELRQRANSWTIQRGEKGVGSEAHYSCFANSY